MVTFRSNNNNNRRPPYRGSNNRRPPYRGSNEGAKFSNSDNFQRKVPGRNNHNASKLIEKYTEMAREALANEDRVLSENYYQHADHFTRVQNEQENNRIARVNASTDQAIKPIHNKTDDKNSEVKVSTAPSIEAEPEKKTQSDLVEKKVATS